MKKNATGQRIAAQMNSRTDGSPLTTNVTLTVAADTITQTYGGGTLTHMGNGQWGYELTQDETNCVHLAVGFVHSTGVNQTVNVYPTELADLKATVDGYSPMLDATLSTLAPASTALSSATWTNAVAARIDATLSSLAPASTALSSATWTDAIAARLDTTLSSLAPADTALSNATWTDIMAGYIDATISSVGGGTLGEIAAAVWDEALAGHAGVGTAGEALIAAGAAGDPWTTALPGAYAAGQAGNIVGSFVDSTLSTIDTVVDDISTRLGLIAPTSDTCDVCTVDTGTLVSGTFTNMQTDDDNRMVCAPVNPGGLYVTLVFQIGLGRAPTAVGINGYWNGNSRFCNVFAYDYILGIWDQLTNTTTRMGHRTSDANYSYPLNREHMDPDTGDVSIRFVSPSTTVADRLQLDRVLVNTVSNYTGASGGGGGGLTSQDVWTYIERTLTAADGEAVDANAIAEAVRDVDNAAPAAGSLGEAVNNAATSASLSTVEGKVDLLATTLTSVDGKVDLLATTLTTVDVAVALMAATLSSVDSTVGAIQAVTDKLDTAMELDGAVYRYTANALEEAPAIAGADAALIADAVWDELLAAHVIAGSAGEALARAGGGAGVVAWAYTVTDLTTGLSLADVDIWVSTDQAGSNVIASGKTDATGVVTFYLDPGAVWVWAQKSGYNATVIPDAETVPIAGAGTMSPAVGAGGDTVGFLDPADIL